MHVRDIIDSHLINDYNNKINNNMKHKRNLKGKGYIEGNTPSNKIIENKCNNISAIGTRLSTACRKSNEENDANYILTSVMKNINDSINIRLSANGLIYNYYNFIKNIIPKDIATYSNIRIMHAFHRCLLTQAKKQLDYGDAVFKGLDTIGTPYIISQLYNKVIRLANLSKTNANPQNESIIDSFEDLVVYGLLALAYNDCSKAKTLSEINIQGPLLKDGSTHLKEEDLLSTLPTPIFKGLEETSTIETMLDYIKMIISNNPDINLVKASLVAIKLKEIIDILQ